MHMFTFNNVRDFGNQMNAMLPQGNLQDDYNELVRMINLSLGDPNLELEVLIKSPISQPLFLKYILAIKSCCHTLG